jgi:hypothetical protein
MGLVGGGLGRGAGWEGGYGDIDMRGVRAQEWGDGEGFGRCTQWFSHDALEPDPREWGVPCGPAERAGVVVPDVLAAVVPACADAGVGA